MAEIMDQSKAEAEVKPYLKRVIYLDHKDRQRQAQTRDQRGANLDDYRQIAMKKHLGRASR